MSKKTCSLQVLGILVLYTAAGCISSDPIAPYGETSFTAAAVRQHWTQNARETAGQSPISLTVNQAIREALAASPELEQIRRRLEAAGEQVHQAEAVFYPRVIFTEGFNVTDNPVFALMNIINQRQLEVDTNFNHPGQQQNFSSRIQGELSIFEGGSRWHDRQAADNRRRTVEADLLAARNRLVAAVTETYYRWLQALDFIHVAEAALEAARTDEQLGEARLAAEIALPSEVLRLKTQTAEQRENLVTAKTNARRLQAALERLMTRPIDDHEIPSASSPAELPAGAVEPEGEAEGLIEQALEHRPELAGVNAMIAAALNRVQSAKGDLWPKLAAQSWYQWDSEDFGDSGNSWMLAVQATWPLFQGGLTLAKISEAQADLKALQARGEQVALDIALEVNQAVLAIEDAAQKIRVAADRKRYAREALEETRNLYQNEVVKVDALLQATVAWNRAEVAYTAALFEGKIAQTVLRQTLGEFANWTEVHHE
ncbi:MAG: TolC family protein [Deltaproteobacteria bacterium]